jgi:hypothetical protein
MTRTTQSWIAGLILGSSLVGAAPATGQNATVPTLMMLVQDHGSVPPNVLEQAKDETTRIFQDINVELIWLEHGDARFSDPSVLRSVVIVHILSREMADRVKGSQNVMGWAAPGTRFVKVCYSRIEAVSRRTEAASPTRRENDTARILGHVVAHEIGHLLLPPGAHSPSGIMRASLDLELAALGGLFFTANQAQDIRTTLAAAEKTGSSGWIRPRSRRAKRGAA